MKIADVYRLLFEPDDVVEIRAYGLSGKSKAWDGWARGSGIVYGYFDNPDDFGRCGEALERAKAPGIYFTLNPVLPDFIARAANRLKAADNKSKTTADKNIECIRWLPIDLDPVRRAGDQALDSDLSTTKDELKAAWELQEKIAETMTSIGAPVGVPAVSGNGAHLLYRLPDLPNDDNTKDLVRYFLQHLQNHSETDLVQVDTKVFNPARIWKLYGTTARKGDHTKRRPHRKSYVLKPFLKTLAACDLTQIAILDPELIRERSERAKKRATQDIRQPAGSRPGRSADADTPPPPSKKQSSSKKTPGSGPRRQLGPLKVSEYLNQWGRSHRVKVDGNKTIYQLDHCVFDDSHRGNDASIIQLDTGALYYQCFHDSCQGYRWQDARENISGDEPLVQWCEGYDPDWRPTSGSKSNGDAEEKDKPKPFITYTKTGGIRVKLKAFKDHIYNHFKPIYSNGDTLYKYDADLGYWRILPEPEARAYMLNELDEAMSTHRIREGYNLLMDASYKPPEAVAGDPMILNLKNKMLNLRTMEEVDHAPEFFSRVQLNVSYDDEAKCPLWHKTLMEIFEDDPAKINVLQQFFGYCLYPRILFPAALFQIGAGGNGKGIVEAILCEMLGGENISHISMKRMEKDFGPIELRDKLLNSCGETETGQMDVTNFKKIAVGEEIQAEVKYKNDIKFRPIAKHMISMNAYPSIKEKTNAFFRRVIVLEYKQTFDGDDCDVRLLDKLMKELDGIFMWALEGLEYVLENEEISVPDSVDSAKERFREKTNPIILYITERCMIGEDFTVAPPDLYRDYRKWCEASGSRHPLGKKSFYEQMVLQLKLDEKTRQGSRMVYQGVGLMAEEEEEGGIAP